MTDRKCRDYFKNSKHTIPQGGESRPTPVTDEKRRRQKRHQQEEKVVGTFRDAAHVKVEYTDEADSIHPRENGGPPLKKQRF